ncbi:hypothetical protein NS115_10820 [Paenibacillus jamilae]|uniref:DUF4280 domain-containing protein n=2 Tax=Paenibacillus TaxID=44249 RepID=E3E9U6_PAEPS|nr:MULTISPECIES: DUF4280 domain-containing protein [Paenibacillus]MCV9948690.1 DUF4280 domain-containing protein [Paenibacillus sp. BT-177]ADO57886.1 hypothetical protein PPSC2_18375 [Paenibacillus polymyxa SC2]AJE52944.1 hypothetical protein RE92_18815 [Paenibacillus polymyxa]KTS82662.1 hypothetical protein NS115_10820 [Paenibacillus jamilae]MEE4568455.1 DUF4280 domain-containing protein [Paenibacillus polymyxa]
MFLPILIKALAQGALSGEHSYVVRGAKLQCSQGTDPGVLNMMYSHGVFIKDKPVLNVDDAICGANISKINAFGLCKLKHGLPCEPEIAFGSKWTGGKEDVLIEGAPALLNNSTLMCSCQDVLTNTFNFMIDPSDDGTLSSAIGPSGGGIISIIDDGQDS